VNTGNLLYSTDPLLGRLFTELSCSARDSRPYTQYIERLYLEWVR
jgi:hypothetical protein